MILSIYLASVVALIIIGFQISKTKGALKYLVMGHICFLFLGLIVRPIILYAKQPNPEFGDSFADSRLIVNGSYNQAILEIGLRTFFGIIVFALCLQLFQRISFLNDHKRGNVSLNLGAVPVFIVLGTSLIANFIEYRGISQSRFLTWISLAALPCIGLAIQLTLQLSLSGPKIFTQIAFIGMIALTLSILQASKSPIFFYIFMVFLVSYEKLKGKSGLRFSPKFIGISVILFITAIFVFPFIQNLKDGAELKALTDRIGQKYFGTLPAIYTILKRFDLFRATSDVWFVGEGAWYNFPEYVGIMRGALEWNFGTMAPNFGGQWAINVLEHSSDTTFSGVVSLSQSAIAEGWLLGGFIGILLTSSLFSLIIVGVGNMTSGNLFLRLIALYVISSNSIFEGGVIANLESLSTGVRTAIITWIALIALSGITANRSKSLNGVH